MTVEIKKAYAPSLDVQMNEGGVDPFKGADQQMADNVGRAILGQFPNYGWMVESDLKQGIVKVWLNAHLHPFNKPYVIPVNPYLADEATAAKTIRNVGGEILERNRLSRERFNAAEFSDALNSKDPFNNAIPE